MDQNTSTDVLNFEEQINPKVPSGLNVLTILTFIGCAIQLLGAIYGFFTAKSSFENKDKVLAQLNSDAMPKFMKSMIGDPAHFEEMVTKSYENRIPIALLSIIAAGLCLYGAMQMRQLKKQGFTLYSIGELLPILTTILFIGTIGITGFGFYFGIGLAALFILLYYMQRKYLTK